MIGYKIFDTAKALCDYVNFNSVKVLQITKVDKTEQYELFYVLNKKLESA